jgi:hypothetical protein
MTTFCPVTRRCSFLSEDTMARGEIHVNDVGTLFTLTVRDEADAIVDIGEASLRMLFKKPSGTLLDKTPSLGTDGSDGVMQYAGASGDLDETGPWKYQGHVTFPGASGAFYTDVQSFRVFGNLE